jgi:tetratricopeptide (TPR) repeat protein
MAVRLRSWGARWLPGTINVVDFGPVASAILFLLFAISATPAQQAPVMIQGTVRDPAGAPVADASVRLERDGNSPRQTITKPDGSFTFAGLASGVYVVSAEKVGQRSAAITVNTAAQQHNAPVGLTLDLAGSAKEASPMEFADAPNFTIAAVTDWTAAGGHGSDAVLRTSEALNRETLALKPSGGVTASPSGELAESESDLKAALAHSQGADAHRLAGELDEKLGDPLAAVHEFERAVREDPSEENYFAWGSELLLHRAVWQAKDVFSAGVEAYPKSARMLTALGAALFAGALYDEAAERLCQASDLNPADPEPYMFMGKIEIAAPNPLACVEQKLARFVELRPEDPLANYYYAMTLWKQKGQSIDPPAFARVQDLLYTAIKNDPQCSVAYLQLGVIEAARNNFPKAIDFYNRAVEADPQLSQAHYRLGVAYDRVGYKEKAAEQFRLHEEIEKQQAALVDKQRREVKQFLVVVNGKTTDSSPQ